MKEVIRSMKRMADYDFRTNSNTATLPEDAIGDSPLSVLLGKRSRADNKITIIPDEEENKKENITATYWG
jgi:hypothetical protein